jgi:hypothetical protein
MPAIGDSHQPWAIPPEWLGMCQRLLSVDLVACFVLAFTPSPSFNDLMFYFPEVIANNGPEHFLIEGLGNDTYHSEPLAQQAVRHVTTSFTAAILHQLQSAHIDSGRWSVIFANAVCRYLQEVLDIRKEELDDDWSHDTVVLALKTLLRESPADFASLRQRVVESDEAQFYSIQGGLNRFFDWVCSDNV